MVQHQTKRLRSRILLAPLRIRLLKGSCFCNLYQISNAKTIEQSLRIGENRTVGTLSNYFVRFDHAYTNVIANFLQTELRDVT